MVSQRGFDSPGKSRPASAGPLARMAPAPGCCPANCSTTPPLFLAGAASMAALMYRGRTGQARSAQLSLARTPHLLHERGTRARPRTAQEPQPDDPYRRPLGGGWTGIAPPGQLDGSPLSWPHLPPRYGQAPAAWSE
jgi:hypothetical protein